MSNIAHTYMHLQPLFLIQKKNKKAKLNLYYAA